MPEQPSFDEFFEAATGHGPYEYQRILGEDGLPDRIEAATGSGKTAGTILAWMYRRFVVGDAPSRLVWCAPMRTLVNQTCGEVAEWSARLSEAGLVGELDVYSVMGGTDSGEWRLTLGRPCVMVGTLDLLLSAAMGAPLGAPQTVGGVDVGLLNSDAHWVYDEVQMFDIAGPTTVALDLVRKRHGRDDVGSTWLSATLPEIEAGRELVTVRPTAADRSPETPLGQRLHATKTITAVEDEVSGDLVKSLRGGNGSTLVVVNTVKTARIVAGELGAVLLHSRFRPAERADAMDRAVSALANGGVVVATQVVEAGVDVSADLLVTELCPWASLVQRAGRCNRYGRSVGRVVVTQPGNARPYLADELTVAASNLAEFDGGSFSPEQTMTGSSASLEKLTASESKVNAVEKILVDAVVCSNAEAGRLPSANVASTHIRVGSSYSVSVLWRSSDPADGDGGPRRDELCPASLSEVRKLTSVHSHWVWSYAEKSWIVPEGEIEPGASVRLLRSAGGYTAETGFDPTSGAAVDRVRFMASGRRRESYSPSWLPLCVHLLDAQRRAMAADAGDHVAATAALFHDLGKTHPSFQRFMTSGEPLLAEPDDGRVLAKSGCAVGTLAPSTLDGLRHEVASFFALCQLVSKGDAVPDARVAYGILSHHGKVNLSAPPLPPQRRQRRRSGAGPVAAIRGVRLGGREACLSGFSFVDVTGTSRRIDDMDGDEARRLWESTGAALWSEASSFASESPFLAARIQAVVRVADWLASADPSG